jgi:hypothetical protein
MPATLGLSTRARSDLMTTQTLGEKAKEMLMENAAAFFLGWILGAGLGPVLWDSIVGVM